MKSNKKAEQIYEQSRNMGWEFAASNGHAILLVRFKYQTMESRSGAVYKTITRKGKVFYNKERYDELDEKG